MKQWYYIDMDKQIIIKDLLISYSEDKSQGAGTLLFLHGWRSSKEVWANVMSQSSIVNRQLFAIDLPGFGGSQAPEVADDGGGLCGSGGGVYKKIGFD